MSIDGPLEYATVNRRHGGDGRPTPQFLKAMKNLYDALRDSPTECEACPHGLASEVRKLGERWVVLCPTCTTSWWKWTPIEKRQRITDIARRA